MMHSVEIAVIYSDIVDAFDKCNQVLLAIFMAQPYVRWAELSRLFDISDVPLAWVSLFLSASIVSYFGWQQHRLGAYITANRSGSFWVHCCIHGRHRTHPRTRTLPPLPYRRYESLLFCFPKDDALLKSRVMITIDDVDHWLACNTLKLNPAKSTFLQSATARHLHLVDKKIFHFKDSDVTS